MPFQSEKQRRFLHANHPEIAQRWERDYANGGILDITGDEEITTDDGNDIELTDYNAAFDDPKDLSAGVKTLFQAKDGGSYAIQGGVKNYKNSKMISVPKDWKSSPNHPDTELAYITKPEKDLLVKADLHNSLDGSVNKGPEGIISLNGWGDKDEGFADKSHGGGEKYSQPTYHHSVDTPDQKVAQKSIDEDKRKAELKNLIETGPGSDVEKYDTWEQKFQDIPGALDFKSPQHNPYKSKTNVDYTKSVYEESLANQKAKLKSWGLQQLIPLGIMIAMGVPLNLALKAFPKTISLSKNDIITLVKHSLPVAKAKKEYIAALENHKGGLLGQVDINNPNEMKSKIGTQISDITNEINNLTKTPDDDDTGGDGPVLPPQLGGPSTEEMATEYQDDWYGAIKEKQAQQKAFKEKIESEKLAREGNPIVSGTETDIIALRNSGGLANLFRVKNQ